MIFAASPELQRLGARQWMNRHARRTQIAFRDFNSHRYEQGMEDSLARQGERQQILLLIHTLAVFFASWLARLGR